MTSANDSNHLTPHQKSQLAQLHACLGRGCQLVLSDEDEEDDEKQPGLRTRQQRETSSVRLRAGAARHKTSDDDNNDNAMEEEDDADYPTTAAAQPPHASLEQTNPAEESGTANEESEYEARKVVRRHVKRMFQQDLIARLEQTSNYKVPSTDSDQKPKRKTRGKGKKPKPEKEKRRKKSPPKEQKGKKLKSAAVSDTPPGLKQAPGQDASRKDDTFSFRIVLSQENEVAVASTKESESEPEPMEVVEPTSADKDEAATETVDKAKSDPEPMEVALKSVERDKAAISEAEQSRKEGGEDTARTGESTSETEPVKFPEILDAHEALVTAEESKSEPAAVGADVSAEGNEEAAAKVEESKAEPGPTKAALENAEEDAEAKAEESNSEPGPNSEPEPTSEKVVESKSEPEPMEVVAPASPPKEQQSDASVDGKRKEPATAEPPDAGEDTTAKHSKDEDK